VTNPDLPLGARALVTGATGGLGAAFAELLATSHHDLRLVARSPNRLEQLAGRLRDALHVDVEILAADLTDPAGLGCVEERIAGDTRLAMLVNCAGFSTWGRFDQQDVQCEQNLLHLNIVALARLTRAALPGMIARGSGAVINVSSVAAMAPWPFAATYCGSKAFVSHFTQAIHEELRGTGVRIQALCPGFVRTGIFQRAGVDISAAPAWPWVDARHVAQCSLDALGRNRAVCIPTFRYRLLARLLQHLPAAGAQLVVRSLFAKYQPSSATLASRSSR